MRIVLAYSGSRDGSAAIAWLREVRHAEVVAVTVDLGQGRTLEAIRDRALSLGAQRAHVLDARDRFAQEFVVPALRADALHGGLAPMGLALSRPAIAQKVVEIADIERADAVAHTGRASGGASRLDRLFRELAPTLPVLTPARDWDLSNADLEAFAHRHGLGSGDEDGSRAEVNFWGRSTRQAEGEPPAPAVPWPASCPREPALVDIAFTAGVPTVLNGVALPFVELVASLGTLAAIHGVGHVSVGPLVCDAPAAVLLHAAHRDLTRLASTPEVERSASVARASYVQLVEAGTWFSPEREALDAFFLEAQRHVTGHVRLRLLEGEYATMVTELSPPVEQPAPAVPSPVQLR